MRTLTLEEVAFVSGGSPAGDTMIAAGQQMQQTGEYMASTFGFPGEVAGLFFYSIGSGLVGVGQGVNGGGAGGGGGGGGGGGSPGGGGSGSGPGWGEPGSGGGGSQSMTCDEESCKITYNPN